jgi:hypothetical protein
MPEKALAEALGCGVATPAQEANINAPADMVSAIAVIPRDIMPALPRIACLGICEVPKGTASPPAARAWCLDALVQTGGDSAEPISASQPPHRAGLPREAAADGGAVN